MSDSLFILNCSDPGRWPFVAGAENQEWQFFYVVEIGQFFDMRWLVQVFKSPHHRDDSVYRRNRVASPVYCFSSGRVMEMGGDTKGLVMDLEPVPFTGESRSISEKILYGEHQ